MKSLSESARGPKVDAELEFKENAPILRIRGVAYAVEVHDAQADDVLRLVRLEKHDGTVHDVSVHTTGETRCTCGDFEFRCRGVHGCECKHIASLRAAGMLDVPRAARPVLVAGVDRVRDELDEPIIATTPAVCCSDSEPLPCAGCVESAPYEPTAEEQAEAYAAHIEMQAEALGLLPPGVTSEADPSKWDSWTDDDRWELTDADEAAELLTLDEYVSAEAARYQNLGTMAGELISRHLASLAGLVRLAQAHTPHQAEDRIEALAAGR